MIIDSRGGGIITRKKYKAIILVLIGLLFFSALWTVGFGAADIGVIDSYKIILSRIRGIDSGYSKAYDSIIIYYRLPRVLMAVAVGMGLAICGALMQSVVHNPIADPYILGISSGGYVGAVVYFMVFQILGYTKIGLMATAFSGSMITCLLVIYLSKKAAYGSTISLILIGSVTNTIFISMGNFMISVFGRDDSIADVAFWTMGSLAKSTWQSLPFVVGIVVFGVGFSLRESKNLDILIQGDEVATTMGLEVEKKRTIYLAVVSAITGFIVANCGIIGFVGLIVPHIARILLGSSHRKVLPVAILLGGLLLVWADALARVVVVNGEIPVGIITSLIGGPLFAFLIVKKGYGRQ